jgi:hypothetical protein
MLCETCGGSTIVVRGPIRDQAHVRCGDCLALRFTWAQFLKVLRLDG